MLEAPLLAPVPGLRHRLHVAGQRLVRVAEGPQHAAEERLRDDALVDNERPAVLAERARVMLLGSIQGERELEVVARGHELAAVERRHAQRLMGDGADHRIAALSGKQATARRRIAPPRTLIAGYCCTTARSAECRRCGKSGARSRSSPARENARAASADAGPLPAVNTMPIATDSSSSHRSRSTPDGSFG